MKLIWVPFVLLAAAVMATVMITRYVAETAQERERLGFEKTAESIGMHLESRMAIYVTLLRATRGLFTASDGVTEAEFASFYRELRLTEQFTGVMGVGFSKRIEPGRVEQIVEERRAQGATSFSVWPVIPGIEDHTIYYLEPQNELNVAALGYNMFTDLIRRKAMIMARDTGTPALSGRVTLVQEKGEGTQPGFLLYFPVYRDGIHPKSLAERRLTLEGFVYAPFRAGDLLRTIASERQLRDVSYAIFDGGDMESEDLLYHSPHFEESIQSAGRFRSVQYVSIARRTWTVVVVSTRAFDHRSDQHFAPLTGYAGALASLLVFAATLFLVRARMKAERASQELEVARAEAERANRLKDQFLATVSHELRTPLNAIAGWTQLLLDDDTLSEETRKGLSVIDRNARAQAALVDELLDVSRIISGRLKLQIEQTDLVRIVEEALETVQPAAEARQIEIERAFFSDSAPLLGDPGRLRQVAWNLLSNSIKFSPIGAPMTVAISPSDLGLELRVSDCGMGISPDFLPYIFTAFRQADSGSTRQHGGLGLGLAIAKQLVELHGGTVSAKSDGEGKGATFIVHLPLRPVSDSGTATAGQMPAGTPVHGSERSLHGVRVLVVDDEEDSRSMMARALEQKGAAVRTADSAQAALEILEAGQVDILISDIGMPGTDGYALIRTVRTRWSDRRLPAIAVTAYATASDRDRAEKAGFDQHLPKPVDPAVLQRAVAAWCGRGE